MENAEDRYRLDIEVLRIIASFGIVWFHSGAKYSKYWYFGLAMFLVFSTFLSGKGRNLSESVLKRFDRIMIPWFVWFTLYGIKNIIRGFPVIDLSRGLPGAVLLGPSIHLWYLPYIFFILLSTDQIKRTVPKGIFSIICGILSACILLSAQFWRHPSFSAGYPWAQYAHASSAVFFGFFLANRLAMNRTIFLIILGIDILSSLFYSTIQDCGIDYPIAFIILSAILIFGGTRKIGADSKIYKISQCSLGVYLIHPQIFVFAGKIVQNHATPVFPILTFLISLTIVFSAKTLIPKRVNFLF